MRVGYFAGTFDPWHAGHLEVVDRLLDENIVDKVLVYPIPNGGTRKLNMKEKGYRDSIAVLSLMHFTSNRVEVLRERPVPVAGVTWVAIIGSDNHVLKSDKLHGLYMVAQEHADPALVEPDVLASSCITADEFVVFCRDTDQPIEGLRIGTRPIRWLTGGAYAHMSSTKVREALRGLRNCAPLSGYVGYV